MIRRTEAIALRVAPFSRTSHMVTWLSPDAGLLTTMIRGACRPKSPFLGQYDLFYTCELLYYARERSGVHIPRECTPLKLRSALRSNWRAAGAASHLASLCIEIAQPHHGERALYDQFERALDWLASGADPLRAMVSCELGFLAAAGLSPNLAPCPHCPPSASPSRFCIESGHWICKHRPRVRPGTTTIALPPNVVDAITATPPTTLLPEQHLHCLPLLSRFLGLFLRIHTDSQLRARGVALQLLNLITTTESHAA